MPCHTPLASRLPPVQAGGDRREEGREEEGPLSLVRGNHLALPPDFRGGYTPPCVARKHEEQRVGVALAM
jgi:hypothetical protein